MKITAQRTFAHAGVLMFIVWSLSQCSDEGLITNNQLSSTTTLYSSQLSSTTISDECMSCTYVVPADARIIDGNVLGLKPGAIIGLDARFSYGNLLFRNITGTQSNPIIIRNCGGVARVNGSDKGYGIKTEKSIHFRITGGDTKNVYGIIVSGGHMGITLGGLSNHFEVDHIEIENSGFAGIMAKTDPGCDEATWRGNFLMKGIALHNNYIHDTGGEGIYAGNSFFQGMNTACGVQLPHEIHYIRIYSNIVKNTGWDAIQLGCAMKGASIHANVIENYGLADKAVQNNGIQIGEGTGGACYNNLIRKGTGNGMIVLGLGDNIIYNNVIDEAGNHGIFCDERYTPGRGFSFLNNTILSPRADGIRIYADLVEKNVIINNIISNPGSYYTYSYPRKPEDAFVYKLSSKVSLEISHNHFEIAGAAAQILGATDDTYRLSNAAVVVDKGVDISAYNIKTDYNYKSRLRGAGYDIGAVEHY